MCLASAVYVNGTPVARDPHLVEPLSRSWIKPQYFLLGAPLLRPGDNTLLVRVSGLSAYQPGFGSVTVGDPARVRAQYERGLFTRFDIKLINIAMSAVLGAIFLLMWLLRRQDTTYGWFALSELTGSLYGYNYIAASPWPFSGTDAWQAFIAAMWVAAGASYAMFLLRYGERRFPRIERAMGAACLAALTAAVLAPAWMGPHRTPWILLGGAFYYVSMGWFLLRALRTPRADYRVLAACLLVPILASFHDFALFLGWVRGDTYLLSLTSVLTLIGIAFVVSYRFVNAMRRVEGFNAELQREVAAATSQLGDTLAREHALALNNTRMGERLNLVRDVHDGFGGTLVSAISELESVQPPPNAQQVAARLREIRDDLRLIIDSTQEHDADLAQLLAPLRHRWSQRLELADMDSRWQLQGLQGVRLGSAPSLDLLRLLQEALTNVLKHSRASRVAIAVIQQEGRLRLQVQDNGVGLDRTAGHGAGLASLRARALRLGGPLQIETPPDGGTRVGLDVAL